MEWNEYMRDYIADRRKRKVCVSCGKADERTSGGKRLCAGCAAKRAREDKLRYPAKEERLKEAQKERYKRRREERRCTDCGRPLPDGRETATCLACAVKRAERAEKRKKGIMRKGEKEDD